jgi:hypothetical protein
VCIFGVGMANKIYLDVLFIPPIAETDCECKMTAEYDCPESFRAIYVYKRSMPTRIIPIMDTSTTYAHLSQPCISRACISQACLLWACIFMGVHHIGVHLIDVSLTGVYLTGVHLTGVHLRGVALSWACIS